MYLCNMECLPEYDCHCHILPGLDDGAADLEESLFLCRWLVSKGYREAVCTSHSTFLYRNTEESVAKAASDLQRELDEREIHLRLIPSLEYRLIPQTWPRERLLPWKGNHILIELPLRTPEKMLPMAPEDEIRKLVEAGYQPVLAHCGRRRKTMTAGATPGRFSSATLAPWMVSMGLRCRCVPSICRERAIIRSWVPTCTTDAMPKPSTPF